MRPNPNQQTWKTRLEALVDHPTAQADRYLFQELNPELGLSPLSKAAPNSFKSAAVLVPVIARPSGPTVLFTVRPKTMPTHGGEISLPGGGVTANDKSTVDAAMREAHEEIGLCPNSATVYGSLGVHYGGLGFAVTPVIALIEGDFHCIPCEREVDDVFEVPMDFLTDMQNHTTEMRHLAGRDYKMFAVPYEDQGGYRHIWGLTAGILESFARAYNGLPIPE